MFQSKERGFMNLQSEDQRLDHGENHKVSVPYPPTPDTPISYWFLLEKISHVTQIPYKF